MTLRKEIQSRNRANIARWEEMKTISPPALSRKHKVATSGILHVYAGGEMQAGRLHNNPEKVAEIRKDLDRYYYLKPIYDSNTLSAMARELGAPMCTVRNYALGKNVKTKLERLGSAIEDFVTMKLTSNPKHGFYY